MTYLQSRKLKYYGRIFTVVILAIVTTILFISKLQDVYTENMAELEALNEVEVQALQTQYLFKKQIQEWKNILLRGQNLIDFEKYMALFKEEFAATQASANLLYEKLQTDSAAKPLSDKFRTSHQEMLTDYLNALKIYNAYQYDAQKSDAEVRGIDREATQVLDHVVRILNNEISVKRNSVLSRLNTYIYIFGIAFLTLQVLLCWLTVRLTGALLKLSLTDKTTQTGNRELFINTIRDTIKKNRAASFAIFDLNNFKIINEAFGNDGGDHYMRLLAKKIKNVLASKEELCRIGGDMLGVILFCDDTEEAVMRVKKIKKTISKFKYSQDNIEMSLTASVGIFCTHSSIETNSQQVLNNLYASLQEAKSLGKNKVVVYSPDSIEIKQRRAQMKKVHEITLALEETRIVLFRQKVAALGSDKVSNEIGRKRSNKQHYYEVLMRVKDRQGCYLSPGPFIAAAEHFNLMEVIDRYIIKCTIDYLVAFPNEKEDYAINLSGSSLSDKTFITFIKSVFDDTYIYFKRISFERISFEITETDIVKNLKTASNIINTLKSYGCKVALDDFGSGMSSYSYLAELDIDKIKIDGTFIQDIERKPNNQAIIRSVVQLSKELGIKTVAEFVETQAELDAIRQLGIDYVQGYVVHKPEFLYQPNNEAY